QTTFNNQGGPSVIQGLEFTMNKWFQSKRWEFAVQWENVEQVAGDGAPQWRYWDANQPAANRWVPFTPGIPQTFTANAWHHLALQGRIINNQVHYQKFQVDNQIHIFD